MRQSTHSRLPRLAFGLLVAADLLAGIAFVSNQWLDLSFSEAWGVAGILFLPLLMLLVPLIDALPWRGEVPVGVAISGASIPGAGQ